MRKLDYDIVHVPPDKGCKYADYCDNCPYVEGQVTITYSAQCIEDIPKGMQGLTAEIRHSLVQSLFMQGFAPEILAGVFHMTTDWTKRIALGKNK